MQATQARPVVLVTGSSRGIGRAIALRLGQDGHDIVLHCRERRSDAEAVASELTRHGATSRIVQFDVANRAACAAALLADIQAHGVYYGVVLNAGITRDNTFAGMTPDEWDSVIHTNLDGFYNVLQPLILPLVRAKRPGRIVVLSSVSGLMGNRGQTNYSASKAGLIGAAKSLAVELASRHITVNCVAPGLIETDMVETAILDEALKIIPAKRMGRPEEVADLVAFLMSPNAAYITRQVIGINGGML